MSCKALQPQQSSVSQASGGVVSAVELPLSQIATSPAVLIRVAIDEETCRAYWPTLAQRRRR